MTTRGRIAAPALSEVLIDAGLDATVEGAEGVEVTHLDLYTEAGPGALVFYIGADPAAVGHLRECVLLCTPMLTDAPESVALIRTGDPRLAFYRLSRMFLPPAPPPGIHPTALVSEAARVSEEAYVGPYCVLEECDVAAGARLVSHVTVREGCRIGEKAVVESGTCLGATGVIWAWGPDGEQWEMAQVGGVSVERGCFIGSNVSIVRGSLRDTLIGEGSHIAHGTMVGHDCRLGRLVHVANNVALGGSVVVGELSFIGSGASIRPQIRLPAETVVGSGAAVVSNYEETGLVLAGVPARPLAVAKDSPAGMPRRRRD